MTESKRRCPYCHSELDEGDLFCKVCGRGVPQGNVRDIEDNSIHIDRRHDYTENVTKNYNTTNNNTNYNTNNRNTYNYYNGQSRKPMSKKAIVGIVALCIIVLIVAICIVGVVNNKPVEETYTLSLSSNPSGAKIYFDDVYKGITPLTVSGIAAGTHVVRATLDGYMDYNNIITVKKSGLLDTITLTKQSGSLNIYASESMALVFVDESYYGTAPVTISSIEPGSHVVKVSKDGFYDATEVVSVTAGTVKNVTLTLSPIIQPTVIPTSVPTQIPTTVPTVKPTTIPTSVPTQTQTPVPTVRPTTVPTQVPTQIPTAAPTVPPTAAPTPAPTTGHVIVSTNMADVSVYIDDVQKGTTPVSPLDISGVTAGTHTLKLTKHNYVDIIQVIDVPAGEYVSLSFTMKLVDNPIISDSNDLLEFSKGNLGDSASLKTGITVPGIMTLRTKTPLTLDLNGGTLQGSGRYVIKIGDGQSLTIKDSIGSGKISGATGDTEPGTYEIYGVGVYIETGGTFILESGSICNNIGKNRWGSKTNVRGIGVYNKGTFIMNGGYVTENTAQAAAGQAVAVGVQNKGIFIMNGGIISHNYCLPPLLDGGSNSGDRAVIDVGEFIHNGGEVINGK